jgi:hypothetical protein
VLTSNAITVGVERLPIPRLTDVERRDACRTRCIAI